MRRNCNTAGLGTRDSEVGRRCEGEGGGRELVVLRAFSARGRQEGSGGSETRTSGGVLCNHFGGSLSNLAYGQGRPPLNKLN